MAELDRDELRKLNPEERIRRLKEMEEERKKELEETDKLMKESFGELEELELQVDEPPEEPPPPEIQSDLENQIMEEEIPEDAENKNVEYAINLYGELADAAQDDGYMNMDRAIDIYEKIKETAYKSQDTTAKKLAEGSRRLMEEVMGEYRANLEYKP